MLKEKLQQKNAFFTANTLDVNLLACNIHNHYLDIRYRLPESSNYIRKL